MSYTPGPWYITKAGVHSSCTVAPVLKWNAFSNPSKREIVEANARLIAASPDLFEIAKAVESIYVYIDSMTAGNPEQNIRAKAMLQKARTVIAKVEGTE
jgi:hypothetical protein